MLAMMKICQAEYKDFGPKHNNLNAFKSVQWWDDLFESSRKGSGGNGTELSLF